MESLDDIMKQMQRDLSLDVTKEVVDDGLVPRVTQQKEDVVYIKNPASNWGFNRILKFANHDASALTISLQDKQAIALMLNRTSAALQDQVGIEQTDGYNVQLKWGATQTATGKILDSAV